MKIAKREMAGPEEAGTKRSRGIRGEGASIGQPTVFGIRPKAAGATHHRSGRTQSPKDEIHQFVERIGQATPMERVELERDGVTQRLAHELATRIGISTERFAEVTGIKQAAIRRRTANDGCIAGSAGQAVIALAELLAQAQRIISSSTSSRADGFDAAAWLGRWIERPQPSLGGRSPADLIGTPTGARLVSRLLGSIESGAYQ